MALMEYNLNLILIPSSLRVETTALCADRRSVPTLTKHTSLKLTVGLKLSSLPPEPRNYREFLNYPRRPQLQVAMNDEFDALTEIDTFRSATAEEIANNEILPA
jgi:hypothetical protein